MREPDSGKSVWEEEQERRADVERWRRGDFGRPRSEGTLGLRIVLLTLVAGGLYGANAIHSAAFAIVVVAAGLAALFVTRPRPRPAPVDTARLVVHRISFLVPHGTRPTFEAETRDAGPARAVGPLVVLAELASLHALGVEVEVTIVEDAAGAAARLATLREALGRRDVHTAHADYRGAARLSTVQAEGWVVLTLLVATIDGSTLTATTVEGVCRALSSVVPTDTSRTHALEIVWTPGEPERAYDEAAARAAFPVLTPPPRVDG